MTPDAAGRMKPVRKWGLVRSDGSLVNSGLWSFRENLEKAGFDIPGSRITEVECRELGAACDECTRLRAEVEALRAGVWRGEQRDALAGVSHCDSCLGVVPNEWRPEFQADLCDGCFKAALLAARKGEG